MLSVETQEEENVERKDVDFLCLCREDFSIRKIKEWLVALLKHLD
jgi:hypothetical protein